MSRPSPASAAEPSTAPRWYATTPFFMRESRGWEVDLTPTGDLHAKEAGGQNTACGLNSTSWPKFFHIDFARATAPRCGACVAVLDSAERPGRERRPASTRGRPSVTE
jgi:hypothetical protein